MTMLRQPAVAGKFYPADPGELEAQIARYCEAVEPRPGLPKAVIAPHAGYIYSGPIAATAFAPLRIARGAITRIVHLGPAHFIAVRGIAASSADAFDTPLGRVPVDAAARDALLELPQVAIVDEAHRDEHCLEVHLPFLQHVLGNGFSLVPLVVGDAPPEAVAEVLEVLWGGDETLFVVSSDLSHYHDYETARSMDRRTSRAIENLQPGAIAPDQACGRIPIQGLLLAAKRHGLAARVLDLRNSGDTAGSRVRVVGYGAWAFRPRGPEA
jgi:hypothetical protein